MVTLCRIDAKVLRIHVAGIKGVCRLFVQGANIPFEGAPIDCTFCVSDTLIVEKVAAIRSLPWVIALLTIRECFHPSIPPDGPGGTEHIDRDASAVVSLIIFADKILPEDSATNTPRKTRDRTAESVRSNVVRESFSVFRKQYAEG